MKMKQIDDDLDLCKVIHYTHTNPVHHGFTKKMEDWPHSSFRYFLNNDKSFLERDKVLNLFGGLQAFKKYHEQPIDLKTGFTKVYE